MKTSNKNNKKDIFVATFDDRYLLPNYFSSFIRNTLTYTDLNFITPKKTINLRKFKSIANNNCLKLINPFALPQYLKIEKLFDSLFVNYSSNRKFFERACFLRWFALNAATNHLDDDQMICLLDSDFLLGMSPSDILKLCLKHEANKEIKFIAEWNEDECYAIGPEISIMSKSYLFGFCRYLLTDYYSFHMKNILIGEYFDRIGNGLTGGVCDMRALASYSKCYPENVFNLRNLKEVEFIRSFNFFLESEVGKRFDWVIRYRDDRQILITKNGNRPLLGTHFQGNAKIHMEMIYENNADMSRDIVLKNLKNRKNLIYKRMKIFNYLFNQFLRIIKRISVLF